MDDIIWIVRHSKNNNVSPLVNIMSRLDAEAIVWDKESLFKNIDPQLPKNKRPILVLLDPNLPDNLIESLIQWRASIEWFGNIQSPVISFVADSELIERLQRKWDPTDCKNIDFEDFDQLLKINIAKKRSKILVTIGKQLNLE